MSDKPDSAEQRSAEQSSVEKNSVEHPNNSEQRQTARESDSSNTDLNLAPKSKPAKSASRSNDSRSSGRGSRGSSVRITHLFDDLEKEPVDPGVPKPEEDVHSPQAAAPLPGQLLGEQRQSRVAGLPIQAPELFTRQARPPEPEAPGVEKPPQKTRESTPDDKKLSLPQDRSIPRTSRGGEGAPLGIQSVSPDRWTRITSPQKAAGVRAPDDGGQVGYPTAGSAEEDRILPASQMLTPIAWESMRKQQMVAKSAQTDQPAMLAYARLFGEAPDALPWDNAPVGGAPARAAQALLLEILDEDPDRSWSEDELLLVEQVTDQLSLALENARLHEETRRQLKEQIALRQASAVLYSALDTETILNSLTEQICRAVDATSAYISSYDVDTKESTVLTEYFSPDACSAERQSDLGEAYIEDRHELLEALQASQHVLIHLDSPDLTEADQVHMLQYGAKTILTVPLIVQNQLVGFTEIWESRAKREFTPAEINLCHDISRQAAVAMERADLFEQTQKALAALEVSERYQKSVAHAVSVLTERGIASLSDVLRILGQAANASRAYYIETQVDPRGSYWRLIADWCADGVPSQLGNPNLRRMSTKWLAPWIERLQAKGYLAMTTESSPLETREFFTQLGTRSTLQFAVAGRHEIPGCIGFEQTDYDRAWTSDEIAALQTAASALANTTAREDLFTQVQINLAETEALYQASANLNSAANYQDILAVLRHHTILGHVNASKITLNLFDRPWTHEARPDWLIPVAHWTAKPVAALMETDTADRYALSTWKTADWVLDPDRPTVITDVEGDSRLDEVGRAIFGDLMGEHLDTRSLIYVPLNVSGRWVGHIIAAYRQTTGFPEQDIRRLTSLAGQSAVAIESLRLLDETRQRNEELATLNQITSAVSRTLELNEVLAEILNRVLGITEFESGLISIADPISRKLYMAVYDNLPESMMHRLQEVGLDNTPCDLVYQLGKMIYVADLDDMPEEMEPWQTVFEGPRATGYQSYLGVPLLSKGIILGTVCLFNRSAKTINPSRLSLMEAIGQQIGVVVDNARLFQSTQNALSETETLYQASAELNAVQSFDEILQTLRKYTILGQADKLLNISLFNRPWVGDTEDDIPEWSTPVAHWTTLPAEKLKWRYPIKDYHAAKLLSATEIVVFENIPNDPRLDEEVRTLYQENFEGHSTVFVPLFVGGLWIGFINGVYALFTQFDEQEKRRLLALAGQAAVAVQNLNSIQLAEQRAKEAQRRSEELALVNSIVASVSASLDLQQSLDIVVAEIAQALDAYTDIALLRKKPQSEGMLDQAQETLTVVSAYSPIPGMPSTFGQDIYLEENIAWQDMARARRSILVKKPSRDPLTTAHQVKVNALMIIPIVAGSELIGTVGLKILKEGRDFSQDEIRLAETIVLQAATAIQNARLFEQTQHILAETEALYQASAQFQLTRTYGEILDALRHYTAMGQDAYSVSIDLYDSAWQSHGSGEAGEAPEWVTSIARWGSIPDELASNRYMLRSFPAMQHFLKDSEITVIGNVHDDPRLDDNMRSLYIDLYRVRSAIFAPLVASGQWIGHVNALFKETINVSEEEIRRLTVLAGQAAVAVQNLRLLEESQRRANQLQTAAEIARDTSSTLALELLLQRSVNLLCERFGYYHASIFLRDESAGDGEAEYAVVHESTGSAGREMKRSGHRLAIGSRSVIGQVMAIGQPIVLNDVTQEEAQAIHRPNPLLPLTRAELGLPLKIADRVIGALDVQSTRANAFSEDDISILQILTDQIAVAVDNARSYELTQKAVDEIREADRLKSQFLANMSHELRTPLNSIIGFSRVILKGIDGPINELQQQDLTAIYNSGQHLLGLINDVLDLSKIEAGKMELAFENDVNLVDIIKGVMSTTVGLVKDKQIELRHNIAPDLPLLRIDPMKVRQVLLNLLSNAAKFTELGTITVEAELQSSAGDLQDGQPEVIVRIIDTGPGITPEDQRKLFQPFSQVDGSLTRKTGGSGLGLSICHHLIRMHGGRIGLKSKVGQGSTFYFTLPVNGRPMPEYDESIQPELPDLEDVQGTSEKDLATANQEIPAEPVPQGLPEFATVPEASNELEEQSSVVSLEATEAPETKTQVKLSQEILAESGSTPVETLASGEIRGLVLAVDKDPQVVDLYKRYLSNHDYAVVTLTDLEQVVTVARGIQPFAITLDVTMQGAKDPESGSLDGWQVLKYLKSDPGTRNIPVIVCTISAEQERAFSLGASDYLLKPILEEDLAQAIHRLQ